VLTLDVEMPKMDGIDFWRRLDALAPDAGADGFHADGTWLDITFRALALGAVDFVSKPKMDIARGMEEYAIEITDKIRAAAQSHVRKTPAAA